MSEILTFNLSNYLCVLDIIRTYLNQQKHILHVKNM